MKDARIGLSLVVIAGMAVMSGTAMGAEASVAVDVASAYVFRGVTFNDGAVIQPGFDIAGLPVEFGVWGNIDLDDYDGALDDGQFSEIDLYGSYALPVEDLDASVGYTEYTYPSGGGEADREVTLSLGFDIPLAPSVALNYGIDGGIEDTLYVELGVGTPVVETEDGLVIDLSAALGYLSPDEGEDGFSHYTASVGVSLGVVHAGVTYVGQIDDDVLPDYEEAGVALDGTPVPAAVGHDVEVFGTVGLALDF